MAASATELRSGMEVFRNKSGQLSKIANILHEEVGKFMLKSTNNSINALDEYNEKSKDQEVLMFVDA